MRHRLAALLGLALLVVLILWLLPSAEAGDFKLPRAMAVEGADVPFDEALARNGTAAWVVLHRGRIVDERYYGGRDRDTVFPVFSVAKSVLGTLVALVLVAVRGPGRIAAGDRAGGSASQRARAPGGGPPAAAAPAPAGSNVS